MLTQKDMLYFTYPIANALDMEDGEKLFVTDTAYDRNSHLAGTIVAVKPGMERLNGRMWRTAEDGSYVTGHPLRTSSFFGHNVVGLAEGEDDRFYHGMFEDVDYGMNTALINCTTNSLARYPVPSMCGSRDHRARLHLWVKGAPWAARLMPRPSDTIETVEAKLELAKAKWLLNRAVQEMAHEGYERGWTSQLKELHENEDLDFLPRPLLGVLYEGEVLLPTSDPAPARAALSAEQQSRVAAIEAVSIQSAANVRPPRIPVTVTLPLNLQLNPDDVSLPEVTTQIAFRAQQALGDPNITLGRHTTSYFVNGLASLIA